MARDVGRVHGWRNRLNALFAPPAWAAQYHASLRGGQSAFGSAGHTQRNNNAAV
jgi:hypothetical protein